MPSHPVTTTLKLTDGMKTSGENTLLVRIGAHPAVLPESLPGEGMYSSKHKWTPGIYDDVSLILCDNPVIETIQVAPRIDNPLSPALRTALYPLMRTNRERQFPGNSNERTQASPSNAISW